MVSRLLKRSCFVLFMLMGLAISAEADDISVLVSLAHDTIGLDERTLLEVTVSGPSQNLPAPRLPTLSMFEVYSQGRSSNVSITNGIVESSVTYRYMLEPTKPGTFPINHIAMVYNNKRYKGNEVTLTVIGSSTKATPSVDQKAKDSSGKSKEYFLQAEVDNKNPFVNQQVTLTLKFFIAVQYFGSPELTEPTTTGFWTEILGNRAAYFQVINNRKYKVIERKYALFPTQSGKLTIGRATIRTTIASRTRRRDPFDVFGDFFGRGTEITIKSNPIKITSKSLPQQGRPANYSGTIGQFRISATADKREVEVNQPVTVTFRLSGTGNIKAVAEPPIGDVENFRVYQASSKESITKVRDKLGGSKIYEEVFIPKRPGEFEIPSIKYCYFDPAVGKYKTISTKSIKIRAIKPEGYIASPEIPYSSSDLSIGSDARDILYIKDKPGSLSKRGSIILFSPTYLVVNSVPILIFAFAFIAGQRQRKLAGNIGLARSKAAGRMARKKLSKASSLAHTDHSTEFYAEIQSALLSYIADKLNISPHGLTLDKIEELLEDKGAEAQLLDQIVKLMNKADYARFAPSSISLDDITDSLKQAEEIMIQLEGVSFG